MNTGRKILLAWMLTGVVLYASGAPAEVPNYSLVVESVARNSQAEQAGIQESDLLTGWSRGDVHGKLESPFDLLWVEFEQSPRGEVSLEGRRGAELQVWKLVDVVEGGWGIQVRPQMPENVLLLYRQGQKLAQADNLNEALDIWRKASVEARKNSSSWLEVWLLFHVADSLCAARQWVEAERAYQVATERGQGAGPMVTAQILEAWSWSSEARNSTEDEAQRLYHRAIAEAQKINAESMAVARLLNRLGVIHRQLDDLAQAEDDYRRALAIAQKLAPNSLDVGRILLNLGRIAYKRGDLVETEKYEREALTITEKIAPGSMDDAWCLNGLGLLHIDLSDFETAKNYLKQAWVIREKLQPGGSTAGSSLLNLAILANLTGDLNEAEAYLQKDLAVLEKIGRERDWTATLTIGIVYTALADLARERGELAKAEQYHRQALAIRQKMVPGSLVTSENFYGIGSAALARDDFETAEHYLQQALAIQNKLAPDSLQVAESLVDLGSVASGRNDLNGAEAYYRRALSIVEKRAPGNLDEATVLRNLGLVYAHRENAVAAEEFLSRALVLNRKLAPHSADVASDLNELANAETKRGELAKAEEHFREALVIETQLAPGSATQAESLAGLAGIMRMKGIPDAAAQLFEQALDAFENHTSRLGGGEESRSGFRAQYNGYYRSYIDLLVEQKKPDRAFQVAERSRARTLLEMLLTTHAEIHKGADPVSLEKERSLRELIKAKSNWRIQLFDRKHTEEQLTAVDHQIQQLLVQYEDVESQIRASSPAYAALTQPRIPNPREIQDNLLDPDTLLLEYTLGDEHSYIFAVTSSAISAYALPKRAVIEGITRRAYKSLTERNHNRAGEGEQQMLAHRARADREYSEAAAELSRMILGPVAHELKGKRLLIVSDGILQYIPFAGLPVPETSGQAGSRKSVPLIVEHEVVNLPSASVLAVLREEKIGRPRPSRELAILADPVFDPQDDRVNHRIKSIERDARSTRGKGDEEASDLTTELLTRSIADIGLGRGQSLGLSRLRYTRAEAEAIFEVIPRGKGMKALDFEASRETATSPQLAHYRIVHFATHGLLDSTHPELSGLVLSMVDRNGRHQDGFLELQDIYNLNLPVDLVVLAACETGLGKEVSGEGLIGLTRGFMYAGASRVVASLWQVSDVGTARLMKQFYRGLESERKTPAAALRAAQIAMWKQPRWSSPYYWAAFQIQGEWR